MSLKCGTNQACAACKYQRRKCAPTCTLAPYFPPDQHKMFLNVHKLFGVKKIQKLLQKLHPSQQNDAMSSIIYQANVRQRFPVYGCVEVIQLLINQIRQCEEELYAVHSMLNMKRHLQHHLISTTVFPLTDSNAASQLQLGMTPSAANHAPSSSLATPLPVQLYKPEYVVPVSQNPSYNSSSNPYDSSCFDAKEKLLNSKWIQHHGGSHNNNSDNETAMPIQSQLMVTTEAQAIHQDAFHDYAGINPYFDTIDDRQSYIVSKKAYDSSPESSLKYMTHFSELVAENELKSAAACFSLTSVNKGC